MRNPYQPLEAVIEEIIVETPTIKTFSLRPKQVFEFRAGQFIELTLPAVGEAPFTPSSDANLKDKLDLTIMNVGRVTSLLHSAPHKTKVGIRGPFGKGYPLDKFEGKEVLIVGGGVGLAPLRSLLFSLFAQIDRYKKVILCYGARTPSDLMYRDSLPRWARRKKVEVHISVDVADVRWRGKVGLVTGLLDKPRLRLNNAVSIVCGPPIMMKFVTLKLLDLGFKPQDIYLSMEKNMSCGLGKCGHCRLGKYYVCKDGPVFTYEELKGIRDIWD